MHPDDTAYIRDKLDIINGEMGELRDSQVKLGKAQVEMRVNLDWIMKKALPRIEKEVWAILFLIVGAGLAFWFFK